MKAIKTLLQLAQGYGYDKFKPICDKYNLNFRTVKNAHELLLDCKLIQRDDKKKIWVFAPVGYVHRSKVEEEVGKIVLKALGLTKATTNEER